MTIRYGSVCSGIEAATVAWHPLGWSPVFFSEIEAFPSAVLAHHYGSNMPGEPLSKNGVPNYGDFTTIGSDAGPIDLLVGGTPCQSFSIAGLCGGLDDERGNLALEYLKLAQRLRPRWLVWENVPGVLSSNGGRDFGSILGGLVELGYGFAYRVLDAQFVRVDGYPRAVPQRRRRVFVVGYLGDWRRAAAVLFERESLSGHPAPRRQAGEGAASPSASSSQRGSGYRNDADTPDNLIAFGGGNTSGAIDVGACLTAKGQRIDFEVETFIVHSLRAEGFDASEDGTGRGTPLVPVAFDCKASGRNGFGVGEISPTLRAMGHKDSHTKAGGQVAVAWSIMPQNSGRDFKARPVDVAQPVMAGGPVGGNQGGDYIQNGWAVRRLTPRECERLQGFPDDYTLVPWRKGTAPDGPRYKGLGNSMAVNVMRWVGERIAMVEAIGASATTEIAAMTNIRSHAGGG